MVVLGATAAHAGGEHPTQDRVVFVASSSAEPYTQALAGFRTLYPNAVSVVLDAQKSLQTETLSPLLATRVSLIIAAGSDAVDAVNSVKAEAPVIATMVLHADQLARGSSWPPLVVHLDIAPAQIAAEIAALFPKRHRMAAIWSGGKVRTDNTPPTPEILFQRAGIQLIGCPTPAQLLPAFLSVRGKTDFVLTRPDGSLYNNATLKPLILASIEHHLPIIGFSESFVRSGAAVGIYPDFHDVGVQTALLAQRFLSGEVRKQSEGPRTAVVAVNQRVLRLLGLDFTSRPGLVVYK